MDWKLFTSTYMLIFIAEIPDKTSLAVISMASYRRPLAVFVGAALAFVVQSLVAVMFGSLLNRLPPWVVHHGSGLLFLIFAVITWRSSFQTAENEDRSSARKGRSTFLRAAAASFMVIFVAEWGDLTQLITATLQAKYNEPWTLFWAATTAMWSVTAVGAMIGHGLKKVLRPALIQRLASAVFAIIGVYLLLR